jgi:hypothetical protein
MPELQTTRPSPSRGRPFPWFCPRCRRKEVRPAKVPYHGVRTCEGRDYTVDVPELIVPQCGNCKELVFNYTAEEQIEQALQALTGKTGTEADGGGAGSVVRRRQNDGSSEPIPV